MIVLEAKSWSHCQEASVYPVVKLSDMYEVASSDSSLHGNHISSPIPLTCSLQFERRSYMTFVEMPPRILMNCDNICS